MISKKTKMILVFITIIVFVTILIINRTNAEDEELSVSITADGNNSQVGDDIPIKINLNKKIITASYYFNYNSEYFEFKEALTSNLAVKDYPDENLIRVVYADISGVGTDEISLVFTVKKLPESIQSFNISNTTINVQGDSKPYSQSEIRGADEEVKIIVGSETPTPLPDTGVYSFGSVNYKIEGAYIFNVSPNTNASDFTSRITTNGEMKILDSNDQEVPGTSLVRTGQRIKVNYKDEEHNYDVIVKGDINQDGQVTLADLSLINQALVNKIQLAGVKEKATDLNGDSNISLADLSLISQVIVGKITI